MPSAANGKEILCEGAKKEHLLQDRAGVGGEVFSERAMPR